MKKYLPDFALVICLLAIGAAIWNYANIDKKEASVQKLTRHIAPEVEYKYGYDKTRHQFQDYAIKRNSFMGDILMGFGVDFDKIIALEKKAEFVFSLRKIAAGKHITFVKDDLCGEPMSFIYQPNRVDYIKFEFRDTIAVSKHQFDTDICIESATGVVYSTLSESMLDLGLDLELIDKMEDALAQVSFFTAHKGDKFKVVYENIYVDGKPRDTGRILSASYQSGGNEYFGFYYENEKYKGYYDMNGSPNKKTFLRAPVRASRISSGFNPNRFHPVLKRRKPHLGTDYAARRGTPIMAVANGVITHKSYAKGNGNYVKIKHDNIYQTQYLHMSRFAKGIRPGVRVSQGQVIGYVGSTGLATGPHVCFRFWKNGRQINHRRENFPPLNPMNESDLPAFYTSRDVSLEDLETISYPKQEMAFASLAD